MEAFLRILFGFWGASYATLLGVFLFSGFVIEWRNQRLGSQRRIQKSAASLESIRRDFWQSVRSLFWIAGFLAGGLTCQQIGLTWRPYQVTFTTAIIGFSCSLLIFDTWFYWGHRLLHLRGFYGRIHAWHHQSVTPTVWSNNSDTFLDNCILQSYFLFAPFFLPIPGAILVFHKLFDQITGMVGHSGFEHAPGRLSRFPSPLLGVTFHDLHHRSARCNFATHFSFWDRFMQTIHPEYDSLIHGFESPQLEHAETEREPERINPPQGHSESVQ